MNKELDKMFEAIFKRMNAVQLLQCAIGFELAKCVNEQKLDIRDIDIDMIELRNEITADIIMSNGLPDYRGNR
jgi:hypothetical protein